MKRTIGVLMISGGIILGLYVSLWVCFIGGIVQLINEVKSPEAVVAMNVAWGVAKIVFAGFAGWVSALILIFPGLELTWKQGKEEIMKYSSDFVKKIKTAFPDWQEIHEALKKGDQIVGNYLLDDSYFSMSPAEIVEAFEQGHEQDVLKEAKRANKSLKLYVEWKAQKVQL